MVSLIWGHGGLPSVTWCPCELCGMHGAGMASLCGVWDVKVLKDLR